jgi:hypothetical protein
MMDLDCQRLSSWQMTKQSTCQARAVPDRGAEILQFAGHGASFGMRLADIAPIHFMRQLSRKADTQDDIGINAMI